jgi:tripartite-type tricarboxylate transporter receptor subunit TctC
MPELPTFAEQGVRDVEAVAFHGLIGPPGMPAEVVARLNAELVKALANAKVAKLFADFGFEAMPGPPADFRTQARKESARWGQVIKSSGVQLD